MKNHAWLKDFDWEGLRNKSLKPPFTPPMKDNYDTRNSTYMFKDDYSKKSLKEVKGMMDGSIKEIEDLQKYFKNYHYDYRERENDGFLVTPSLPKDIKGTGTKFMT